MVRTPREEQKYARHATGHARDPFLPCPTKIYGNTKSSNREPQASAKFHDERVLAVTRARLRLAVKRRGLRPQPKCARIAMKSRDSSTTCHGMLPGTSCLLSLPQKGRQLSSRSSY